MPAPTIAPIPRNTAPRSVIAVSGGFAVSTMEVPFEDAWRPSSRAALGKAWHPTAARNSPSSPAR